MLKEIVSAFSATMLTTIFTNGIAIAALAWLAKKIISVWLSKDIEAHKARLQADSAVEIEKLRNSLHQMAYEHDVVFSRLHEQKPEGSFVVAVLLDMGMTHAGIDWFSKNALPHPGLLPREKEKCPPSF
jgi:hypothetical protein